MHLSQALAVEGGLVEAVPLVLASEGVEVVEEEACRSSSWLIGVGYDVFADVWSLVRVSKRIVTEGHAISHSKFYEWQALIRLNHCLEI
jgi:hypothetical protein